MNGRDAIFGRVRAALRDVPAGEALEPPAYEPPLAPSGNAVARFPLVAVAVLPYSRGCAADGGKVKGQPWLGPM